MKDLLAAILTFFQDADKLEKLKPALLIGGLIILFIYLNTASSFVPVTDGRMAPLFSRGDLLISHSVSPENIKAGDLIIFKVPPAWQNQYDMPPVVCHSVIGVQSSYNTFSFRTRGQGTVDDPFMTSYKNILGVETTSIPLAGYPLLLVRNFFGRALFVILILLFLARHYRATLTTWLNKLKPATTTVTSSELNRAQEHIEIKMAEMTEQVIHSMNGFSAAMSEYAQHIASHTGAIKSLAQVARHMESVLEKQDAQLSCGLTPETEKYVIKDQSLQQDSTLFTNKTQRPIQIASAYSIERGDQPKILFIPSPGPAGPVLDRGIEVTPELKMDVREFILTYNLEHGIAGMQVTPELRAAVWDFIQNYGKRPPLNQPGSYISAIQTVKIVPDSIDIENPDNHRHDSQLDRFFS
jgi:signal peptidase I